MRLKLLFGTTRSPVHASLYGAGALASFYLAYSCKFLSILILGYLFCLIRLAALPTARQAFYAGLATGVLTAVPQLYCFWTIFGPGAIVLWLVLAFWLGLFVALVHVCRVSLPRWTPLLIPVIWTGLEYFRSELYYLRFSWLNVGYAFAGNLPLNLFHPLGMYGIGCLAASIAAALCLLRPAQARWLAAGLALTWAAGLLLQREAASASHMDTGKSVAVAGVQLEFPTEPEVMQELNNLLKRAPDAELLVLSEYTFLEPVPACVLRFCRNHGRYLVVGGEAPATNGAFYNTAFVISPEGEVVFSQAKSVPIQFFKDGLPAREQKLWESPWGRLGICICYDLSYTRVTDRLIRLGAQALIVPTMDVADWGKRQHELHARVAPVRAAEYDIPIFRLASSGISQLVDRTGAEQARAGFPGDRELIRGRLWLGKSGSRPLDRWLAPLCVWVTAGILGSLLILRRAKA